jgi:microcystin-dependent protein
VSDQFIGEIRTFPFNFAPVGWAICDGTLLSISQHTALFSLLGTFYGGNGISTFALPNLLSRVPIGVGQGSGLSLRSQGQTGGTDTVQLTTATLPSHTHVMTAGGTVKAKDATGDQQSPALNVPAAEAAGVTATYSDAGVNATMKAGGITFDGQAAATDVGGGGPHENRQPHVTLNYCIALQGVFPPRP